MSSLNPCENINTLVNAKIGELEHYGTLMKSEVEAFRNQLKDYVVPPSVQGAVDAGIAGAVVDDINAGTTALTQIKDFTGTCLDQIYNDARKFANEIDGFVSDSIDDIASFATLPEVDLLSPLKSITSGLETLGLEALVSEIDDLLGCLADQGSALGECLDSIDSFNDRIDNVINFLGLEEDGSFDLDGFVSNFAIEINTDVIDNVKEMSGKVADLATEAVTNVTNNIPATVNPASRF